MITVTFAGCGDAFGSGGRFQACIHLRDDANRAPFLAYTGDTAWTPAVAEAAHHADLLIAEAYYWDKAVPHHLRYADLTEHEITARRVVLTHMSADMLARQPLHETARDGLAIRI